MPTQLFRTKSITSVISESESSGHRLQRSLSAFDLTMIGIGAIIGAGIFAMTGNAAATKAGPAVVLSFVLSGMGCAFAGLCYAEMAAMIPVAGSAYTYAYATLGELFAWIIGWALVLEYAVGAIAVAISWSGYLVRFLADFGLVLPFEWVNCYFVKYTDAAGVVHHGLFNIPAVILVLLITMLLVVGVKESARATAIIVFVKIIAVLLFVGIGSMHLHAENWTPFLPFGPWGIVRGAGTIFFAYIGFDAVTTMSEEAKNAQRDLPIGIIASLVICTVLYIAVAGVLTGMVPYLDLKDPAPVALALSRAGVSWGVKLVSIGALAGLGSVVTVMMMGQPRVFLAMSRDGLLPPRFGRIHPKFQTPSGSTILTGVVVAACSSTLSTEIAGDLTSMGTLFAFVLVCLGVLVLRKTDPGRPRPFKTPLVPVIPALGIATCLGMMAGLDKTTWMNFLVWLVVGLVVYFSYGKRNSVLANKTRL